MLNITSDFVKHWVKVHDDMFACSTALQVEEEIREWLTKQREPKYLDKKHFVRLGRWKTPRQVWNYEANDETLVEDSTRSAYQASDARQKINILTKQKKLRGVRVPVASTILHFLHPRDFPIFDIRVRSSLREAGKWSRSEEDASSNAYSEYIDTMRSIAAGIGVSLRELDKALWSYNKWKQTYQTNPPQIVN